MYWTKLLSAAATFLSWRKGCALTEEEQNRFRKPFELGWTRQFVVRAGDGKKKSDVYYKIGKTTLRSRKQIGEYLNKNGITELTKDNFCISANGPISCLGVPFGEEVFAMGQKRRGEAVFFHNQKDLFQGPMLTRRAMEIEATRVGRSKARKPKKVQFRLVDDERPVGECASKTRPDMEKKKGKSEAREAVAMPVIDPSSPTQDNRPTNQEAERTFRPITETPMIRKRAIRNGDSRIPFRFANARKGNMRPRALIDQFLQVNDSPINPTPLNRGVEGERDPGTSTRRSQVLGSLRHNFPKTGPMATAAVTHNFEEPSQIAPKKSPHVHTSLRNFGKT